MHFRTLSPDLAFLLTCLLSYQGSVLRNQELYCHMYLPLGRMSPLEQKTYDCQLSPLHSLP